MIYRWGITCLLCILMMTYSVLDLKGSTYIIPYPKIFEEKPGYFYVDENTALWADEVLIDYEKLYSELFLEKLGLDIDMKSSGQSDIRLIVDDDLSILNDEGYRLQVSEDCTEIISRSYKGIYYGLQTMFQLMTDEYGHMGKCIPCCVIEDSPRFEWRGCMLDVSRTFMPKPLLMRYINLISQYKINKLHLHLTDDQGWRLEIKGYPDLINVGSKFAPKYNEMGGYYTQDDIRDIIAYASARNVEIIPEFEIPGHELAAIASYPHLSCRNVNPEIHPYSEGPGIHTEIFCAGNPKVYEFIYDVLDEIIGLFPSEYIHIGGDEAPKDEWEKCKLCQKAIIDNHLANEEELQSFLVSRVCEYLSSKGKVMIGWDEITDCGKLTGKEVVMHWRPETDRRIEEMVRANGIKVISCPTSFCYFDYDYNTTDTRKVYSYEPVPVGLDSIYQNNYLGVQANFWSHIDRSEYNIDRQLFPRLFALAEIAWGSRRDWESFRLRARGQGYYLMYSKIGCYCDKGIFDDSTCN